MASRLLTSHAEWLLQQVRHVLTPNLLSRQEFKRRYAAKNKLITSGSGRAFQQRQVYVPSRQLEGTPEDAYDSICVNVHYLVCFYTVSSSSHPVARPALH